MMTSATLGRTYGRANIPGMAGVRVVCLTGLDNYSQSRVRTSVYKTTNTFLGLPREGIW